MGRAEPQNGDMGDMDRDRGMNCQGFIKQTGNRQALPASAWVHSLSGTGPPWVLSARQGHRFAGPIRSRRDVDHSPERYFWSVGHSDGAWRCRVCPGSFERCGRSMIHRYSDSQCYPSPGRCRFGAWFTLRRCVQWVPRFVRPTAIHPRRQRYSACISDPSPSPGPFPRRAPQPVIEDSNSRMGTRGIRTAMGGCLTPPVAQLRHAAARVS
jgi:hypothetical protein